MCQVVDFCTIDDTRMHSRPQFHPIHPISSKMLNDGIYLYRKYLNTE